ncbi:hypothetical protein KBD81_02160 [Candidatus Woesebacteria bacterium]|nr:hypothetical protein [Candidatus Woesebacteria bacterium]
MIIQSDETIHFKPDSPSVAIEKQIQFQLNAILIRYAEFIKKRVINEPNSSGEYHDIDHAFTTPDRIFRVRYKGRTTSDNLSDVDLQVIVSDSNDIQNKDGIETAFSVQTQYREGALSSVNSNFFRRKDATFITDPKDTNGASLDYQVNRKTPLYGTFNNPTASINHRYVSGRKWTEGIEDQAKVTESQAPNFMSSTKDHPPTMLGVSSFRHLVSGLDSALIKMQDADALIQISAISNRLSGLASPPAIGNKTSSDNFIG